MCISIETRAAMVVALALVACESDHSDTEASRERDEDEADAAAEVDEAIESQDAAAAGPLYYRDIAPILSANCLGCHQEGGIAPFTLTTYDDVVAVAPLIKTQTETRTMPPFLPDNSGACATYHDALWLAEEEIALIGEWVDADSPAGDPGDAPPSPEPPQTLEDDHSHIASMTVAYSANPDLEDDYRCFVLESDLPEDERLFLTDFEVVPGEARVVHHAIVYQATTAAGVDQARALEDADELPGYGCFGGSGVAGARMLMNWAPGTGVVHHPAGTGVPLEAGLPLVMQVHYNLANGALPDQTSIRMKAVAEVEHEMVPWFAAGGLLNLPPGKEEVVTTVNIVPSTFLSRAGTTVEPMMVMGVRAHMHKLGTRMRIDRVSQDMLESSCLVDIPRYDFDWQRSYFLVDPVPLGPDESVRIQCTYDTTSRTENIVWGEGTDDEMCLATLYTIRVPGDSD